MTSLTHLPGGDLVAQGLKDYEAGQISSVACLVAVGWPRLRRAGITLSGTHPDRIPNPHHQLYQLLGKQGGDTYSQYNALLRQLISFEQALEQANERTTGQTTNSVVQ